MTAFPDTWALLIVTLPTSGATARMRIWRAIKTIGCAALRDGAYLLPAGNVQVAQLRELADEARQEGGQAWLLNVRAADPEEESAFRALFDRTADYAELQAALSEARNIGGIAVPEASGFEAMLAGARARLKDDDALLAEIGAVLDSLYAHFSTNRKP
jgi:hypothetical protein